MRDFANRYRDSINAVEAVQKEDDPSGVRKVEWTPKRKKFPRNLPEAALVVVVGVVALSILSILLWAGLAAILVWIGAST